MLTYGLFDHGGGVKNRRHSLENGQLYSTVTSGIPSQRITCFVLYSEMFPVVVSCLNLISCLNLRHASRSAVSVCVAEKERMATSVCSVLCDSGKHLKVDPFFLLNESFQLHYSFLVSHTLFFGLSPGSPRLPEAYTPERGHYLVIVCPVRGRNEETDFYVKVSLWVVRTLCAVPAF